MQKYEIGKFSYSTYKDVKRQKVLERLLEKDVLLSNDNQISKIKRNEDSTL